MMRRPIHVPLVILGLGNVGRALLQQIVDTRQAMHNRLDLVLDVIGLADSQGALGDRRGLERDVLERVLRVKIGGQSLRSMPENRDLGPFLFEPGTILVDTTASDATTDILRQSLHHDCGLVLANKKPLSLPWSQAQPFYSSSLVRYEATAGAGLPALSTLHTLLQTGDRLLKVEGCLSGTLGYLCAELERDIPYADVIATARDQGYTEPDPRDDLGGLDVARKALILGRTAGWKLEMSDLGVEPLYPASMSELTVVEFLNRAQDLDSEYADRVALARSRGNVLRYVARATAEGGSVGLAAVPQSSPLGSLRGPANYIAFYTERYRDEPLVISGPGAGPEVTAAGVLGDLVHLALQRSLKVDA